MQKDKLFGPEQELWDTVLLLWEHARERNMGEIERTIHPEYSGWEASSPFPHDARAALDSISSGMQIMEYRLNPLAVRVFGDCVGVAHYTYDAEVLRSDELVIKVKGRWSEVYMKDNGRWVMVSVQGGPERPAME